MTEQQKQVHVDSLMQKRCNSIEAMELHSFCIEHWYHMGILYIDAVQKISPTEDVFLLY